MNTTENNKIIAEFMGYKYSNEDEYLQVVSGFEIDFNLENEFNEDLLFHSDWNWLMEVVEKIESISFEEDNFINVTIGCGFDCTIQDAHGKLFELSTCEHTKIKTVYNACVYFIEWHNEQKN